MERGSMEKLKFDRRLSRRRDWVSESALDAHVETLPDVADKGTSEESEAADADSEVQSGPEDAGADQAGVASTGESTPPVEREF